MVVEVFEGCYFSEELVKMVDYSVLINDVLDLIILILFDKN